MTKEENIKKYKDNKIQNYYKKKTFEEKSKLRQKEHIEEYYKENTFKEKNEERAQQHIEDFYDRITFEKHEPLREESKCTFGIYKNGWERAFHNCHVRAKNFIGYISEFKKKMEDNFEEGMTWDNYGEWEVDHTIPLAKNGPHCVDNVQPMWKLENRQKFTKILPINAKKSPKSNKKLT